VVASIVFSQDEERLNEIFDMCNELNSNWMHQHGHGAVLQGLHAEGPVISFRGALPNTDEICKKSLEWFESEFLDRLPGIKIMTISPSLESKRNYERIKALIKRDIVVSLGHDKTCSEDEILEALRLSSETNRFHITHAFNAQTFHHRDSGLANFSLLSELPNIEKYKGITLPTMEIIGDMIHVSPLVLQLVLKSKNLNEIVFVSDSIRTN